MNTETVFDKPDVKQLVHAFSLLDDEKDIQAFLTDICTPREICDLSQRLQVARYLDEGEPYVEVQARTGASSTTVSRVSKALNGEYGGYRQNLLKNPCARSSLSWRMASRPATTLNYEEPSLRGRFLYACNRLVRWVQVALYQKMELRWQCVRLGG